MKQRKYSKIHKKPLTNIIPRDFLEMNCYGSGKNNITDCIYYITADCPGECNYALRIAKGISHQSLTGLERFRIRYGEDYKLIGVGSKM